MKARCGLIILSLILVVVSQVSATAWNQLGADIDGEAMYEDSGDSVSISADGTRVAIGAPNSDSNGLSNAGHVRIFEYSAGTWNQLGADINGKAVGDYSGSSVSISADGTRVAIGASYNDGGHVRIFEYSGGSWSQLGADIDGEAAGDQSGKSVSLSSDGTRVAIGAPYNDGNEVGSGHVRIYKFKTYVDVGIVGSGTVSPPSGIYELDTNLVFEATADAGWLFVGWSGDMTGDFTTATTNLFIDDDKSITATFSDDADGDGILNTNETALGTDPRNSDSDSDGLSDSEELYTYFTDPLVRDMDGDGLLDGQEILIYYTDPEVTDTDLDGFSDFFEVNTGFDPTLATSSPDLHSAILTAIEFQFNAANGISYRIEATDDLLNSWEVIETDIIGSGDVVKRLYSIQGQPNRYFRARRN